MRYVVASILTFLLFLSYTSGVFAAEQKFITVVNPIRGSDFFQQPNLEPIDNLVKEWNGVRDQNLPATWLIRPDALSNQQIISLLKTMPANQEIGLFMEITPTWAKEAGVSYHTNQNWHASGTVFLTGYEVSERQKLIDSAFEKFKQNFGYFPKSVGAWWIDANSLNYMKDKYGVVANMDVSDQYTTDNYQVWGQYWSTPFYPNKRNALIPASGEDQKIGVVTIQWAARDPFNAYGNGVLDSTYSVQANDYANPKYHNLDITYFNKLLAIYLDNPYAQFGQVTVGLENDFSWDQYGKEYLSQLDSVEKRRIQGTNVLTMSNFAKQYAVIYPKTSGSYILYASDPLGSDGSVVWFQNSKYRIGWFYNQKGSLVRDLRLYENAGEEPCLNTRCDNLNLAKIDVRNIDEVTYGDKWIIDEGKISDIRITNKNNTVEIDYKNQLGNPRVLKFLDNDIAIDSTTKTVAGVISDVAYGNLTPQKKIDYNFTYQLKDGLLKVLGTEFKNLLIFLMFSYFFFFLPGLLIIRKIDEKNTKFLMAWPVGIAIFTLVAYGLGFWHLWWGIVVLPILSLVILRKAVFLIPRSKLTRNNLLAGLVLILGSISWLATSVKNGLLYDYGLGFWGPTGHDAIWHLSLIEALKNGLPPQNPIFANINLQNYHYFYDLLLSATSFLTTLSAMDLYFRFFPLIITLGIGLISFKLASVWFKSELAGVLACFFIYFGGSFGWIVSYFRDKTFGGETLFWAQQAISTLINPPFAISILIFLAGLYLFHQLLQQKKYSTSLIIPLVILWGSLIEFKSYAGILVLGALGVVTTIEIFKKNIGFLKIFIPTFLLSLLVFLPNNYGATSLVVFSPFWLIDSMIDFPDRLSLTRLTYTRLAGFQTHNYLKIIGSEGLGLLFFLVGNLGTRILGIFYLRKRNFKDPFNIFIFLFLLLSFLLPLLFIQKGANFNTIQFFYYFIVVFGFLAAFSLASFIKKLKLFGWVIALIIILLTIPTTLNTLDQYLPQRPPARISLSEVEALNFLKTQPMGVVASPNYDNFLKGRFSEPLPIFAYVTSSYISAISGKPEFVADTENLEILGIDYKGRIQAQKDIFDFKEPAVVKNILKQEKISYLYIPKATEINPSEEKFGIKKIFDNDEVTIYKIL